MKRIISIVLIITMVLTAATAVTSDDLDAKMEEFAHTFADFIPRASTQMNLWADAHIGNILPLSGLPHLGGGLTFGGVLVPTDFMSVFGDAFTDPVPTWESFPIPATSVDVRVGGIILPFDLGLHIMALDNYEADFYGVKIDMPNSFVFGADLRFAILQEGVICPALSLGVGYTYASGDFTLTSEPAIPTSVNSLLNDPCMSIHLEYTTHIYSATAQLSKKILLVTPFVGAKAIAQKGTYYGFGSYEDVSGCTHDVDDFSFEKDDLADKNIKFSVFGGVGVDFLIFQTTIGVNYDFTDQSWAGSISLHVKI